MTIDALDADQDPAPAGVPWQQHLRDRSLLSVIITATLTGMLTMVALQLRILTIRTDTSAPEFATGDWVVADLGSNLPSAALVALIVLVGGIIASADGRRWGMGLIAGSSSALAGWALLAVGLAEQPVQEVRIAATLASPDEYTATITRTAGWAVVLMLVVMAMVAAVLALRHGRRAATAATTDTTAMTATAQPTHGWRTAALGTLFVIATALGPLVPVGNASPLDNVSPSPGLPGALLITRAAQLALLVVAGVVGFRWRRLGSLTGLTVVAAALSIPAWLTATSLFGGGGSPVGLAARNPGALPPVTPVTLTVVGVVGALAMIVTTGAVVIDSRRRRGARSEA